MRHLINFWMLVLCVLSVSLFPAYSFAEMAAPSNSTSTSADSVGPKAAPQSTPPSASSPFKWMAPCIWVQYLIPLLIFLGGVIVIVAIRQSLPNNWSMSDALSEEVYLTPATKTTTSKDASGNDVTLVENQVDGNGKLIFLPEMRASSSRVIAVMGMVVILLMYMGFGIFALFSFGGTGDLPEGKMDGVVGFLLAGMTLFAPYAVNKFSELFKGLTGNR